MPLVQGRERQETARREAARRQLTQLAAVGRAGAVVTDEAAPLQVGAHGAAAADRSPTGARSRSRTGAARRVKLTALSCGNGEEGPDVKAGRAGRMASDVDRAAGHQRWAEDW